MIDASRIVICSFYTSDDHYTAHAERLAKQVEGLGILSEIRCIEKQPSQDWADICRQKIPFIFEICETHPDKKVFWTDVDCHIFELPDQIRAFSADIIGFQRGFRTPLNIGYQNRSRFWEPCFWGVNTTSAGRRFIAYAAELERTYAQRATDDFFFEESWRANCAALNFQIIPSSRMTRDPAARGTAFFAFGSSGRVAEFQDSVAQHTKPGFGSKKTTRERLAYAIKSTGAAVVPQFMVPAARKFAERSGLTSFIVDAEAGAGGSKINRIRSTIKSGDLGALQNCLAEVGSTPPRSESERALLQSARAIEEYLTSPAHVEPLPVAWWLPPAPGNFGDWLTPYIFRSILKIPIRYIDPMEPGDQRHIFSIGSIGKFVRPNSLVIGTGISRADAPLNPSATYVSLRGPLTGQQLTRCGGRDPEAYGDPGLVLSRIFQPPKIESNGRVALVRHYAHRKLPLTLPEHVDELSVLMSSASEIEAFISKLVAYDLILTSAMHVFIICQSYGLKAALLNFEGGKDAVHGDGIKYEDFFLGAGLRPQKPTIVSQNLREVNLLDLAYDDQVSQAKIDEVYAQIEIGAERFLAPEAVIAQA